MEFYRIELKVEDGLRISQVFILGRLVLEVLWEPPRNSADPDFHLWGITLFDFVTIGAGCFMTVDDRFLAVAKPPALEIPKERFALIVGRPTNAQVSPA